MLCCPAGFTDRRSESSLILGESNDPMIQIEAMNALATNGKQAIDIITEIINSPEIDKQVKTQALVVMETIKNKDN